MIRLEISSMISVNLLVFLHRSVYLMFRVGLQDLKASL